MKACGPWFAVAFWLAGGVAPAAEPARALSPDSARRPSPHDNFTFRPTVIVRKGPAQGSGTIVSSVKGTTFVLTAAHVVKERGPLVVELHRYNVGREREPNHGEWPRKCPGEIVARDTAADLAVLRLGGLPALPYVARLAVEDDTPARGALLTSVGIDRGSRLTSWNTRLRSVTWLALEGERADRPFFITEHPPEHGRSGGGLYVAGGGLIGVCVGRLEKKTGSAIGFFASADSIRRLLRDYDLEATVLRAPARRPAQAKEHAQPGS